MNRFLLLAKIVSLAAFFTLLSQGQTPAASPSTRPADGVAKPRRIRATDVFDTSKPVMFADDFRSSPDPFVRWNFSENDVYDRLAPTLARIDVVSDVPGLAAGERAVRFHVDRSPGSFRSEIELPSENGWQERWYGGRIYVSADWQFDPNPGRTIVMQWHGVRGNFRPTFPNLDFAIANDRWLVTRAFGDPKAEGGPSRERIQLDEPVKPGTWSAWVLHAKWSPGDDGLIEIWKDRRLVVERKGPNVYGTIGIAYTPYLQMGIYHPAWNTKDEKALKAFEAEQSPVPGKTTCVADVKIGTEKARYEDVAPGRVTTMSQKAIVQ